MKRVDPDDLRHFVVDVLVRLGADNAQARIFATALVWSDLVGKRNHGVWRFDSYLKRFSMGLIKCPCRPIIDQTAASTLSINGDSGFGHYLGQMGMEHAIDMAKQNGVGIVTVSNSNHFGCAGYFVDLAARQDCFGIATSNSVAKVAAPGGAIPVFGTNPIAFGIPARDNGPIIVDMATAAASGASVLMAAECGEALPKGIMIDKHGEAVTDPRLAPESTMLPFGGAKGGGISLVVEILSAVLAGAALSTDVRSMFNNFSGSGLNGHFFMAIDIQRLLPLTQFFEQLEILVERIKSSNSSLEAEIRIPGERGWSIMQNQFAQGVELEPAVVESLKNLAGQHGVSFPFC